MSKLLTKYQYNTNFQLILFNNIYLEILPNICCVTVPAKVTRLKCAPGDYSITLKWEEPSGNWTGVEVNVTGKNPDLVKRTEKILTGLIATGLQPAKTYSISVIFVWETMRSSPEEIECQTHSSKNIRQLFIFCYFSFLILLYM